MKPILKILKEGEIIFGSVVKCRVNGTVHVGEVFGVIGDTSYEVILYDKRLKPMCKLDGSFKIKKLPINKCKLIDENFKFNTKNDFELGDIVIKTEGINRKYGIVVGFTHPDGLVSTSYESGYNGTDLIDCVEIEKRGLRRKRDGDGGLKRFCTLGSNLKICEVDLWNKSGPKITHK